MQAIPPISHKLRWATLLPLAAAALVACGGGAGDQSTQAPEACLETGTYACKTGETEPLYTFQWALNYAKSWFTANADAGAYGGGLDLNVEPVHRQGIKGQGVNVLVIDSGVDLEHEDLKANADYSMSWNFETSMKDPSPLLTGERSAHGTNVAGIIGAAQNGKGVMGIAPLVKLGGVAIVTSNNDIWTLQNFMDAYGGAAWSSKAHVINASYGEDTQVEQYQPATHSQLPGIRSMKSLRNEKGIVFVKSAGNAFDTQIGIDKYLCGPLRGAYDCTNPANDPVSLEPNVIVTAALNAKGQASSYSSAGSVVWITGMAGESGVRGTYGESSGLSAAQIATGRTGDGPTIFSTDIRGCAAGISKQPTPEYGNEFMQGTSERVAGTKDNPNCDYSYMNGTSSAAPTIAGVVALMLSANPDLSWRDVRDILRLSARTIDLGYEKRTRNDIAGVAAKPYNALFDLKSNSFVAAQGNRTHITQGSTQVPVELGWVTNAAGNSYSNWYGFGVPDAAKAVELALLYKKEPQRSRPAAQALPAFKKLALLTDFNYQQVSLLGEMEAGSQTVDELQFRLSGNNICLGSIGIAVQSPAGTVSLLKMPLDHFYKNGISNFTYYGLGSYAFYGENAKGTWKVYALASNPQMDSSAWGQSTACAAAPVDGVQAVDSELYIEARFIAQ